MTIPQISLLLLFVLMLFMFIWGRFRHDVVAFGGLMLAVIAGLVPGDRAFDGLSHTATVTVAFMLIISRALLSSGATDSISDWVSKHTGSVTRHVASLAGITAAMSTMMNNVGALALTLPVAIRSANNAGRSPSLLLMPISFAALLGGLVTLIGTPPNIIAASFRARELGEPFRLFDFTWVGLPLAVTGVTFLSVVGWRFLPKRLRHAAGTDEFFDIGDYVTEVRCGAKNLLIGRMISDVAEEFNELDVAILGLLRDGRRVPNVPRRFVVRAEDVLIVEVAPASLPRLLERFDLEIVGQSAAAMSLLANEDVRLAEVVVTQGSELDGRSDTRERLAHQFNVNLLAVARQGARVRDRIDRVVLRAGDVLLLQGEEERLAEVIRLLGFLPLAGRSIDVGRRKRNMAVPTIGLFATAILLSATGVLPLEIALGSAAFFMVVVGIVPTREIYDAVEWPVIVLLACMIPIGDALETTGLASQLALGIIWLAAEQGGLLSLVILLFATMLLTDMINNAATVVIMAPVAIAVANAQSLNVDTFIMAVAIGASCAFLTPIGHQNNTLVMGPGGYNFGDYWRMGLPLQIVLMAIGIPLLLFMWPIAG
ncbi:MAG: SLC13 family permease [Geminicoccaceae bacterium]